MKKIQLFVILILLFCASAILNFATYERNLTSMGDNAIAVRKAIIEVHSVLLAILVGGLFAKPPKDEYVNMATSLVAILFSILWAVYIYRSWVGYPISIGANGQNGLIEQINERSTEASAVIAGMLGYLCKKEHVRKKAARAGT